MNELLNNYTQEEIEELALKQITSDFDNIPLKIEKVDKEYKEHNKKAIIKAIFNGSIILLMTSVILKQETNLANFGTNDLSNILNEIKDLFSWLPKDDLLFIIYTKLFDGLNLIIDKIGLIGIVLATKSFKFIFTSVKDTSKSIKLKKELDELNKALIDQKLSEPDNQKR